jgi:hypothetical protein
MLMMDICIEKRLPGRKRRDRSLRSAVREPGVLADREVLLKIPLFFVTSISTGYLVQEMRVNRRQLAELREVQKANEVAEAASSPHEP